MMRRARGMMLLAGVLVAGSQTNAAELEGGQARALGLFSPLVAESIRDQARDALAQDARWRELRFRDAAQPGWAFSTTRLEQPDIDAGRWTATALFDVGGTLFHLVMTSKVGYGAADLPASGRFQRKRRGGPDARRCADCHWIGGPAGAGSAADNAYLDSDGDDAASALVRNPIALSGIGVVELLAKEMSRELVAERDHAVASAKQSAKAVSVGLTAKGVSFGSLTVRADGSLDTTGVQRVDDDLVVRPFGWKGSFATVRDVVEDSLLVNLGMQTEWLERDGDPARVGNHPAPDRDGDGVSREITEGQLTALTLYIAMQPVPAIRPSTASDSVSLWASGRSRFESIGCAGCHVPVLDLDRTVFELASRSGGSGISVDLAREGAMPRLEPSEETEKYKVFLFSDLARHHMGEELAEPRADRGVAGSWFLTRPLWGMARSGPYLHDGRAPTLEDAVLAHGGEARAARERYAALTDTERAGIRTFLTSLTRARQVISR